MLSVDQESGAPQPVIVPRPEHTLSRKDISVEALKVLYRLHYAGYTAYLVGGGVRDLLLGKQPKDFDVVTDARPGEIRKLFRNSRIIGRRFRLVQVFFRGGKIVEVSTFRRRSEFDLTANGEEGKNPTYGTPAEDAQRRDLTINALFYNIGDFSLVDYVGGLEDLRRGYIRVIGDPSVRFARDPVRMLRVLRHAARTGFAIDPQAWAEIQVKGDLIRTCPPARVRDELLKDLKSGAARPFFQLMLASGLFYAIFPGWRDRLGAAGEARLLELAGRLDILSQAERPLPESLIWALFLLPYLEAEPWPSGTQELREFLPARIREALGGIEFPRQRQEEVVQLVALAAAVAHHARQKRPCPSRLTRLAAFPQAYLLHRLLEAPPEALLAELPGPEEPLEAVLPRRRRPRRRRGRKRGEARPEPQKS
jgi:poly(A) polymerase